MASLTDFAENRTLDALLRGQALGAPATWHIALYTVAPSDSAPGTEVTGGSYARAAVAASLAAWAGTQGAGTTTASSGTGGLSSNNGVITFPTATAAWGTVVAFGLMDALTGGNLWVHAPLTTSRSILSGDVASFAAATLTLQVA